MRLDNRLDEPVDVFFLGQTRSGNERKGLSFPSRLRQLINAPNWNRDDSWTMLTVLGKLTFENFLLPIRGYDKAIDLVRICKLILIVVVPKEIVFVASIFTIVLCVNDNC